MNQYYSLVGRRIKAARERAGLTQAELAEQSGLPLLVIQEYEAGTKGQTYKGTLRIAKVLKTTDRQLRPWPEDKGS